jgi:glycine dehydrogenase
MYHGPDGLRAIAGRIQRLTGILAAGLEALGHEVAPPPRFDTLRVTLGLGSAADLARISAEYGMNFRIIDGRTIGISMDETVNWEDLVRIWEVFHGEKNLPFDPDSFITQQRAEQADVRIVESGDAPANGSTPFHRESAFLTHPVFNSHRSETEMLRYLKRLESRDLSLCQSMIPLGSCTMKLNAAAEMYPVSWPEFGRMHPFAPAGQVRGYERLVQQMETWLADITGFAAVSMQPNAGAQGEYAGLLAIRAYHASRGETQRNLCLIPTSAHGTNPASAVMAGLRVMPVACDAQGNVDVEDLQTKANENASHLAALMVTYPSTHGVFEGSIRRVCEIVHEQGGQVYMDGANMNAQVGLTAPGDIGADVCHLNLHKTFCIPHGGGGPGVGPICVAEHLAPFLPRQHTAPDPTSTEGVGPVSGAPLGSAGILPISWAYIRMMGAEGLVEATQVAILNANYIAARLEPCFPTLYRDEQGLVAHECILDLRHFKRITAEDVAKRLMDFGIHAPTLSWPVAGTLMVEPTESESLAELDRFCEAMIAIHREMQAVESGVMDPGDNPLKQAPHTADMIAASEWPHPYTREQAAFPVESLKDWKFWPAVGRVDNVHGDRNLVCSCAGMDAYT